MLKRDVERPIRLGLFPFAIERDTLGNTANNGWPNTHGLDVDRRQQQQHRWGQSGKYLFRIKNGRAPLLKACSNDGSTRE